MKKKTKGIIYGVTKEELAKFMDEKGLIKIGSYNACEFLSRIVKRRFDGVCKLGNSTL